ncbi:MAG: ShlB/FhaC/HecB family hemolysin secretion/activation protein [Xenococcaceae cyanobacterium MO_207.B15]|nr:ShlB/FhaC/HecB family hemolysin secretion/activation protein [Xenococcaceae cyanobacterium MO_207.B15]
MKYLNLISSPFLFLFPLPANAQTIQPVIPPEPEITEPSPLPPLEENILTPESTPNLAPSPVPLTDTVIIRKFEVLGNTVFTQEELDAVLKPYTLRPISFTELLEAQIALTNLYLENGYINSGVFIPPQDIEDRVVKIQVVEGIVETIEITGLDRLNTNYVRSRLELATGAPLNQNKLLEALQLLRLDPLIAGLSAELSAGVHPGSSILEVKVQEADAFSVLVSYDNYRVPSVGTDRRQAQITHNNLLGFGDRVKIAYINTDGSDSLSDLSYTIPINPYNGTIQLVHRRTDSEIIEEPFDELNIESESRQYEIAYRQPVYQTPNQDVALGIAFTRDDSKTPPLAGVFSLSRGSNEAGEINISALRLFQEYVARDETQVLAFSSQFSIGIDLFDATVNGDNEPDSKFFAWRGQAQYFKLLSENTSLLVKADLQLADRPLVALEQFSLGGVYNVRGYRQDLLFADNGFSASAEIRTSILEIRQWQTTLQFIPFVDFGTVWSSDDLEFDQNTLVSVGAGLRLQVSDFLAARLDWGIPLVDVENRGDSLQEDGIYFSLELKPF